MGPQYFIIEKNFKNFGVQFYNFTIEYTNKKSANFRACEFDDTIYRIYG